MCNSLYKNILFEHNYCTKVIIFFFQGFVNIFVSKNSKNMNIFS